MTVDDLIRLVVSLPAEDKARIRATLNTEAEGVGALDVLDLPLGENDANAATVRHYFKAQLRKLWTEREGFSGKRPFGNSGWEYDLDAALVGAGKVAGTIDEYGDCDVDDRDAVEPLVLSAIDAL
jgi:hypothetical protein